MKVTILLLLVLFMNGEARAQTPTAKNEEICFSPDEECDQKLIDFVKSASESIDIAIYDINLDQLVHQLAVQSKKIKVRVVVDKRQSKGNHSLVSTLIKAGVNVRYGHQRGIQHNKFTIVDNKMIETGSFNYTNHATKANQENQIYLSSSAVVKRYKERFEKMWQSATETEVNVRSPSSVDGTN